MRRTSRSQILLRRVVALVLLVGALAILGWLSVTALGGDDGSKATTPTQPLLRRGMRLMTVTRTIKGSVTTTVIAVPKPLRIIFPEGFTRAQMAQRVADVRQIARRKRHVLPQLNRIGYLRATARPVTPACFRGGRVPRIEGFLFPATYDFLPKTTAAQLVQKQLAAFCANWRKVDLTYAGSRNLTPYDVLIIASMVEKETLVPAERKLVAAVIYNRLRNGIALGIDATIRYGLGIPPTQSIRESQLDSDSPYNTRNRLGLPPTPIANPGLASMQAAANPAQVDYLYFARKPDRKHHFFTADVDEFNSFLARNGYGG